MSNAESTEMPKEWHGGVRQATLISVLAGFGVALAGTVPSFLGDQAFWLNLPRAMSIAALLGVSPALAGLSLRGRSLMLLPAGVIGVAGILGILSVFGLLLVPLGLVWLWGYLRVAPRGRFNRKFSMALVLLLWMAAIAPLFLHLDPVCEQRFEDGTVVRIDPGPRGFEAGWVWDVDTSTSTGFGSGSSTVINEVCSSDVVVVPEMLVSVGLCVIAVFVAWRLAGAGGASFQGVGLRSGEAR